jgi:hypothetical protein
MHLDLVQFLAEQNGFACLAPSGLDFSPAGEVLKKTLCFKNEKCFTTNKTIYLDAHSMLVTSVEDSGPIKTSSCTAVSEK